MKVFYVLAVVMATSFIFTRVVAQPPLGIYGPRSIDQELDHLTKDLELTADQRKQIRPLLEMHHDRIQVLMDKNPTRSRQELGPPIHAISDQTHREIEALLTDHQKSLAKAMQERMHAGEQKPPEVKRHAGLA